MYLARNNRQLWYISESDKLHRAFRKCQRVKIKPALSAGKSRIKNILVLNSRLDYAKYYDSNEDLLLRPCCHAVVILELTMASIFLHSFFAKYYDSNVDLLLYAHAAMR